MRKSAYPFFVGLQFAGLLFAPLAQAGDGIRLDAPMAGWREAERDNAVYSQTVNYPASSVSSDAGQSDTARIRGRIGAAPKPDAMPETSPKPATLVVNGVAMPLRIEDDGSFDRPYIFSPGSNSVEIRDKVTRKTSRTQFYHAGQGATPARLRILLSWDSDFTDLDLHVITPDGSHAWYGERALDNGGAIDVDVTTGYGPEIFSSPAPASGTYLVFVNYYGGGYGQQDEGDAALTIASVTIITEEGTVNEKRQFFSVPMRNAGELTQVARFSY